MRFTPELIKKASAAGFLIHAHDEGFIVCETYDDKSNLVEVVDCQDFIATVVCTLKTYRFRDSFFTAYQSEDEAATELRDHLDFLKED